MSKKHKNRLVYSVEQTPATFGISEEYSIIQRDLLRVVILNALYLTGILALYYTNLRTHYLEHWFSTIFHL